MNNNWTLAINSVIACVIIYVTVKVAVRFAKRNGLFNRSPKFIGPPCLPIIGNAHLFIGGPEAILKRLCELEKSYPSYYRVFLGNRLIFCFNSPEQLKVALNSPQTAEKGELVSEFVRSWLGSGLFSAPTAVWRVHRRLIQPTFNVTILKSFVKIFSSQSIILGKKLAVYLDGPEFEIRNHLLLFTMDVICQTAIGVDLQSQTNGHCEYAITIERVLEGISKRLFRPWLHPNYIFRRTRLGKDQQKCIKFLHEFTDNVIRTKRKQIFGRQGQPGSSADDESDEHESTPRCEVFLDHMMKLCEDNDCLTDQEIRQEVDTLIFAGHQSTATVICFTMLMLASHPDVQEKAYQELREIYGDDVDDEKLLIAPEDLARMSYLECVLKETLRLFPVAPFLPRQVETDIDMGVCTLPKGSYIASNVFGVHRNEKYWCDPLKFDPDRFLPENITKQQPYTYLPFGAGPKNCIGQKFGMMMMKTCTATLLRKYIFIKDEIVRVQDIRLKLELLLSPAVPIKIRVGRRT